MYAKTMSVQPAVGPLQIQSVVDHVYSALRERILSGDLTGFAERLGVPRIGVPTYQAQAAEPAGAGAWAEEHERITEAIEAGDADEAERLTREHIQAHPPVAPAVP